ncbi:MAG: hypothetical protein GWN14_08290 [candidate division Zixibacteria bacterium]|nr:hypothetical protein [Gammaproteobacteria bacterium]NIX55911.1 hypothetical protein [candidate division Zixibacteria bacterium]
MSTVTPIKNLLPVRYELKLIYFSSLMVAILMIGVSAAGLLMPENVYPTEELVQAFLPNDVVNLLFGLPILAGSMWLSRRGKLVGLLCWPGALFFVLYNYLAYVFVSPLSWTSLVYLSLVMLCVYSLIGLAAGIDGEQVKDRLSGKVPEKFGGAVLAGFGLMFLLRVFLVSVGTISGGEPLTVGEYAANFSDFFTSPAMLIVGVMLWQRKSFGYAAGLALLFQASMLFIALIVFLLLQPVLTTAPFAPGDVIVVFVMGLICFVPFGLFLNGVLDRSR